MNSILQSVQVALQNGTQTEVIADINKIISQDNQPTKEIKS